MKQNGSLLALVVVVLISMTGFGVFLPIFPFLALDLGATPAAATIAMGAYSFGQLVASPLWGRLSDRVGRKPVLIAGLIGSAASYLWLSGATSIEELGAARLFGGLMAGNVGAAFAAAADLADNDTRARNMGLLGAGVGFGFIAGPALGAMLIAAEPDRASFALVCTVSAALAFLAALAAAFLFRETRRASAPGAPPRASRLQMLRSRPILLRLVIVMTLAITAQALMETTFGLWAEDRFSWGPREVGWTLAALGVAAIAMQGGAAGAAARLWGERVTLLAGLAFLAVGLGGLGAAQSFAAMVAALAVLSLGIGLAQPALNALIAAQAQEHERGVVMGLSQSGAALGRVLGPLFAGATFEALGAGAPFIVAALLILLALFVAQGEPRAALDTP